METRSQLSWGVRCLRPIAYSKVNCKDAAMTRHSVPGWLRLGGLCAIAYFVLGQLLLALAYPWFTPLPPQSFDAGHFRLAAGAIWLVSVAPAFARHPHSARSAAYSAGAAVGGGLALHVVGRALLWPSLEGGCQVEVNPATGYSNGFCADLIPSHWHLPDFLYAVAGLPLGSMATAFLLGAAVIGIRAVAGRREFNRIGT